jgi:hypothetical protein
VGHKIDTNYVVIDIVHDIIVVFELFSFGTTLISNIPNDHLSPKAAKQSCGYLILFW